MIRTAALLTAALAAPLAFAGPEWTEMGDAGESTGGAQSPINPGGGPLAGIKGMLEGPPPPRGLGDFEDVYRIIIKDFENFSAFVVSNDSGVPTFDTQLFLFDEFGFGILGNDDNSIAGPNGESGFFNFSTDGSGDAILDNGIYFLAISGAGNVPLNAMGDPIFNFATPGEVSGADGSSGPPELFGWSGAGAIGEYTIQLTGASYFDVPAPGAAGLFALAGLTASRRRRAA